MATSADVLTMLLPAGGWIITADDFDSVIWVDDRPRCTKADFEAGFTKFDLWKSQQAAKAAADKAALLTKLGITEDEARLLLS